MAINRVEIKDFLVFKGDFAVDFCPGVNVFIGGNGTGKTTLLKVMSYGAERYLKPNKFPALLQSYLGTNNDDPDTHTFSEKEMKEKYGMITMEVFETKFSFTFSFFQQPKNASSKTLRIIYIPEKDILEHAKGLLTFIEEKQTGFIPIYKNILVKAQDIPNQRQTPAQEKVGEKIAAIIGGKVAWDKGDGSFYTIRTDGLRIPFANEASGYKKFGFLGLLVACGQLDPGTILFWDEPENSLNPELVPKLVEILLELSRNGVQIFLATHSEILSSYFPVLKKKDDSVMFYSLYKDGEQIKCDSSERFDLLIPNTLTAEQAKLYEEEVARGLGDAG
jgi:predicted ATPase